MERVSAGNRFLPVYPSGPPQIRLPGSFRCRVHNFNPFHCIPLQGLYRNMKTKFHDFSRIIPGLFSVFKDSISLTFSQFLIVFAKSRSGESGKGHTLFLTLEYFHYGIDKYRTIGKLNRSIMTHLALQRIQRFLHRFLSRITEIQKNRKVFCMMYFITFKDDFTVSRAILQNSRTVAGQMALFSNSRSFPGPRSNSKTFPGLCEPCPLRGGEGAGEKTT